MSNFRKVEEFHRIFGLRVGDYQNPGFVDSADANLRHRLMREEYIEVVRALQEDPINMANVCKELVDLLYVVYGTGVTLGLDLDAAFEEVHRSNMSKLDANGKPIYNEIGKVMKGENYKPPDIWGTINATTATTTEKQKPSRSGK